MATGIPHLSIVNSDNERLQQSQDRPCIITNCVRRLPAYLTHSGSCSRPSFTEQESPDQSHTQTPRQTSSSRSAHHHPSVPAAVSYTCVVAVPEHPQWTTSSERDSTTAPAPHASRTNLPTARWPLPAAHRPESPIACVCGVGPGRSGFSGCRSGWARSGHRGGPHPRAQPQAHSTHCAHHTHSHSHPNPPTDHLLPAGVRPVTGGQ